MADKTLLEKISLRRVTLFDEDVDAYLALEQSVIGPKTYSGIVDREEVKEEIKNNVAFFIELEGVVVGSIEYEIKSDDRVYLSGSVINPNYQGKGLGHVAAVKILEKLKEVKEIYLVTHPHNTPVLRIFLSLGFVINDWIDNYYGDGEPRVLLSKEK